MRSNRLILLLLSVLCIIPSYAQGRKLSEAEKIIPRDVLKPVKSFIPDETDNGMDTLDTENPMIKIILCENGQWHYWKDPEVAAAQDVFKNHWDHVQSDSYKLEWEDFPLKSYVWLVDSTSHYC